MTARTLTAYHGREMLRGCLDREPRFLQFRSDLKVDAALLLFVYTAAWVIANACRLPVLGAFLGARCLYRRARQS